MKMKSDILGIKQFKGRLYIDKHITSKPIETVGREGSIKLKNRKTTVILKNMILNSSMNQTAKCTDPSYLIKMSKLQVKLFICFITIYIKL